MKLTIDVETFSLVNLKTAGLYRYAEDPGTDILCLCWAFNDGPVHAWVPSADPDGLQMAWDVDGSTYQGPKLPADVASWIAGGGEIHAWNAAFERRVLNGPAGQRYGFPHIEIEQTRCSMARARHASMPGSLEECANVLNATVKKRVGAVNAMRYLCKPRADGSRPTISEERDRFLQLIPYCADDVRAERAVDALLPELSPKELKVYHLDQRINDRGVKADLAAVDDFEVLIGAYKKQLKEKCLEMTGISPSRPGPLSDWIRNNGFPELENLQADSVRKALPLVERVEKVPLVLKLYSTYNMKAVAKFPAVRNAVCKDGRLRGMLAYHAAATGRWSSYIVQIHNLFRSVIDDPDNAIEAAKTWDLEWIRALYPGVDPMKVFASCVRGMLIADEGKEFVFPDFSGVEARGNAWLWNEEWKLEAYRLYDRGEGPNPYSVVGARCFNIPVEELTKKHKLYLPSKAIDLSGGYGGGVGAFVKMAGTYKIDLNDIVNAAIPPGVQEEAADGYEFMMSSNPARRGNLTREVWVACEGLKILWRRAHPRIVAGWSALECSAMNAITNPGEVYKVASGRVMFKVEDQFLVMRLPSGRKTRYFQPRLKEGKLFYQGVDTVTRQWGTTSTYGGKLCENVIQGFCRDLLVDALLAFEGAGHTAVLHIHDEPVLEAKTGQLMETDVSRIMCTSPAWAAGMPLAMEGHRARRYRK